ncbi:MAG: NINE protein [Bacteroidetes bacterium]|nr:NINE protein [Bacteroidota bacterium]
MKDKNVAGILALFFGWIGIHRFYLGQVGLGIFYCIFFWTGITFLLGLIDAIVLLSMDKEAFDIRYNKKYIRNHQGRDTDFDRRDRSRYRSRDRWEQQQKRRQYKPPVRKRSRRQYERSKQKVHRNNPFKASGVKKFKDYDYDGAIEDFKKAFEIDERDVAVHFNIACAYSLNENAEKAFYHLDRAVEYGFTDFHKIKEHDAFAFIRIKDEFEKFEKNGFRLVQKLAPPKEDLLDAPNDNLLEQLKKLDELRKKGLLTEQEFSVQKKKLLG